MSNMSNVLKELRLTKKLTIAELALKSKTGTGTIGDIERGKNTAKIKTLEKICKGLNLSPEDRERIFLTLLPVDLEKKFLKLKAEKEDRIDISNNDISNSGNQVIGQNLGNMIIENNDAKEKETLNNLNKKINKLTDNEKLMLESVVDSFLLKR